MAGDLIATGIQIPNLDTGSARPAEYANFIRVFAREDKLYGVKPDGTEVSLGGGTALSDATPQALGTAAAGTSDEGSRADHVHAKNVRFFGSGGEIRANVKIWTGTVTSDGNGDFTVDYSSAGFTGPPMVTVSALSTNTDTVRDKEWATLRETPTTTSANGYTLRGNLIVAILIGGAETVRDAPNVVVQVHAIGV